MKRYIVITGAAGFIGSGVVQHLNEQGKRHLILVDDCTYSGQWKNLAGKQFSLLLSRHQLMDWLKTHERDVEAVIHLGACSDTTETDVDFLLENNYRYTIRLAEWACSHNKRFIYASSAATYGNGALGFSDEISIESLRPLNPYGFSKQLVDLWMQEQGILDRVVGLKYFNVFGPNEYHKGKMASMVFKMTHIVNTEGKISLFQSNEPDRFADGEQQRDFIYVKDAVRMTCEFLSKEVGGIFNIGRGQPTTWNTLAKALFSAFSLPVHIVYIPMPDELLGQYQNYTCAEMGKYLTLFPNTTFVSEEDAVREYVSEYLLSRKHW